MHEDLLRTVTRAEPRGRYRVFLCFDDGTEGELDLGPIIGTFRGVFAPLSDPAHFAAVIVDSETGTIGWPSGAGIDPVVLYCAVKGIPVPAYEDAPQPRTPKTPAKRTVERRTSVRHRRTGT